MRRPASLRSRGAKRAIEPPHQRAGRGDWLRASLWAVVLAFAGLSCEMLGDGLAHFKICNAVRALRWLVLVPGSRLGWHRSSGEDAVHPTPACSCRGFTSRGRSRWQVVAPDRSTKADVTRPSSSSLRSSCPPSLSLLPHLTKEKPFVSAAGMGLLAVGAVSSAPRTRRGAPAAGQGCPPDLVVYAPRTRSRTRSDSASHVASSALTAGHMSSGGY